LSKTVMLRLNNLDVCYVQNINLNLYFKWKSIRLTIRYFMCQNLLL
jgi:hypothetical protein